jgi:hypothetical protein
MLYRSWTALNGDQSRNRAAVLASAISHAAQSDTAGVEDLAAADLVIQGTYQLLD